MSDPVAHIPSLGRESIDGAADSAVVEVWRQDELARSGRFEGTHVMPGGTDLERLAVLAEEFGEVSIEVCKGIKPGSHERRPRLREELIQTAAVCLAWVAAIDENRPADVLTGDTG